MHPALEKIKTPAYVLDEAALRRNLEILRALRERTGVKILLAQKAFSCFAVYPLIAKYLDGTAASGLYEAKLGRAYFPGEVHVYAPAYKECEFPEIAEAADHIVFNSPRQLAKYRPLCEGKRLGLRINPECSTQENPLYDPCAPGSRFGVRACDLSDFPEGIEGLHFHTLCEQDAPALKTTLDAVEKNFGNFLGRCRWINFGGGHHITRPGYHLELLETLLTYISQKYDVQVYLEPGEAVVLNAGYLVTEVIETLRNGREIAILDTSAACHMPDVLEMPYRPPLAGAGKPGEKPYTYRLASQTCLAGDIIGDYSFDAPLHEKDRLVFEDMALYTMVKNNTFNGMPLPDIGILHEDGSYEVIKRFGYENFKERLS